MANSRPLASLSAAVDCFFHRLREKANKLSHSRQSVRLRVVSTFQTLSAKVISFVCDLAMPSDCVGTRLSGSALEYVLLALCVETTHGGVYGKNRKINRGRVPGQHGL